MARKGRARSIGGRDMRAQASFVAELFPGAAWVVSGRPPPRPPVIFAAAPRDASLFRAWSPSGGCS